MMLEQIQLPAAGFEQMRAEAQAEGFRFLDSILEEWVSGANRFDRAGEGLYGFSEDGALIAIGGLNCDAFLGDPDVGRIRRVYVRRPWRDRGIGTALLQELLKAAWPHFQTVRLRADNADAARLYERLGFVPQLSATATHVLRLNP